MREREAVALTANKLALFRNGQWQACSGMQHNHITSIRIAEDGDWNDAT